jgi:spermidine/putrescine-binding protein
MNKNNKAKFSTNRRSFLGGIAYLGGTLLTGCNKKTKTEGPFSGKELNVFVYAGGHEQTMRKVFVPRFEDLTGAKVIIHSGWWEGIAKLKTAPSNSPPFDLMICDATQGYPAIKEGIFAQLNLDNIPNHKLLFEPTLDNWVVKGRHGLTYPDSVMTLAFNKNLVEETPDKWEDLIKPNLKNKIGLYSSFYLSLFTFACMKAGLENQLGTAHQLINNNLDEVLRFSRTYRDHVKLWWPTSNDMILALANQDITAGNMHSPEYITALREKETLGASVPLSDRAFVQVFWAIPAESKNKLIAESAINELFSREMQLEFARRGSATSILSVAETMAQEDIFWKKLYPHTKEQFSTLQYYPYETYAKNWKEISETWDRTILRKG